MDGVTPVCTTSYITGFLENVFSMVKIIAARN
jgi:hypothetical protein